VKVLVLEDDPNRIRCFQQYLIGDVIVIAVTAKAAIESLKNHKFDLIFLDHDLEEKHYTEDALSGTGSEVANFLANNPEISPRATIIIHSLNPVGVARMRDILQARNPIVYSFINLKSNAEKKDTTQAQI
jgi:CheY-like chemotaxis protein